MKILFLTLLFSNSVMAEQIFSDGLNCIYSRTENSQKFKRNFSITKTNRLVDENFRLFGVKVLIEKSTFKVEFAEGPKRKVINLSVKDVWSTKRQPSELTVITKMDKVELSVSCR